MHLKIPQPFKGLVDSLSYSGQPPETSLDLSNVRPRDKIGRRRFAKRPGTKKYTTSGGSGVRLSNNPVRYVGQGSVDGRKNTYVGITGEANLNLTTPRATEVRRMCFDRQGNMYIIEAFSNITKYNDQGNVVWSFQPPGVDGQQVLCRPFVDPLDNLYVGVVSGGSQTAAKFWRFTQTKGSTVPVVQWEVTPGAFIRNVWVRGDAVYAALNYPDRYGAFVVQYTGALNTGLTEAWRTPVAYPVNDMKLKPDGAVIGCSLPFADRGLDPRYPLFTRKTVDATYRDVLPEFDRRVWRWNRAASMVKVYANNDAVSLVADDSGKDRTLFTSLRSGATQPKFRPEGAGGNPSIYFRGERSVAAGVPAAFRDELQTQISASKTAAYADGAQGFLPNYVGAKWVLFLLVRPEETSAEQKNACFGQPRATASTSSNGTLFFNRNNAAAVAAGIGTWLEATDAAGVGHDGTGAPLQFDYTVAGGNTSGMVLLALASDGGDVQGGNGGDNGTVTHSFLRYNGQPIDRWISVANSTTDACIFGDTQDTVSADVKAFRGELIEALVLRDSPNAPQGLIGAPLYPTKVTAGAAVPVNYATATTGFNASEVEKVEGIIAHANGMAHLLPRAFATGAVGVPTLAGNYPHVYSLATTGGGGTAFGLSGGWFGPPRATNLGRSEPFVMHSPQGIAWKLDGATGALQWCVTSTVGNEAGGGIGYSINCSNSGEIIYSVGPPCLGGSVTWNGLSTSLAEVDSTVARAWVDKNGTKESGYNTSTVIGQKAWIVQNKIAITGGVWNQAAKTLTATFTGYTFTAGDVFVTTGGAGTTANQAYAILSGNSTVITITTGNGTTTSSSNDINGATGDASDIAGYIIPVWLTTEIDIDVDDHDNVHVPWAFAAGPTALTADAMLKVFAREPDGSGASNVGRLLLSYDDSTHAKGYCAVCPPSPAYRYGTVPPADFERNPTGSTVAVYARSEFVWVGAAQTGSLPNTSAGLFKVRLVTATPTSDPARVLTNIQVNNGVVAKFTTSTMAAFAGPSTLATPQLSTTSQYVAGAQHGSNHFLTDGRNYVYCDLINDSVLSWKSTDGGKMPERCKLLCMWRGRMVLARGVDDPQNWHMSALGNPFSWDQFKRPLLSTRAISGNNARVGMCPDKITALIPYTDDILIFLCETSVWALYGDPADEGQRAGLRQVSSTTGGAFGDSWCIDPNGTVYFFGSRGGVYAVKPGSNPLDLTAETVDQRLRAVDLTTYRPRLVWDTDQHGLHVILIPLAGTGVTTHYFWDEAEGAWTEHPYPYSFGSVAQLDGDTAAERILVFGRGDGYIGNWDATVYGDDGAAIPTRLLIGPMTPDDAVAKWRFVSLHGVLDSTMGGVTVNIYDSQVPDAKGVLRTTCTLQGGENIGKAISACAPYVWIEVTSNNADATWAIERLTMEVYEAGRRNVATQ